MHNCYHVRLAILSGKVDGSLECVVECKNVVQVRGDVIRVSRVIDTRALD